jgi:hypothetical protein
MAGWQDMNGSMGQTVTYGIAHNISTAEEKVDLLESERSMEEDLRVLSIRSVSSAVGRTLIRMNEIEPINGKKFETFSAIHDGN